VLIIRHHKAIRAHRLRLVSAMATVTLPIPWGNVTLSRSGLASRPAHQFAQTRLKKEALPHFW
jgi:hypothetical protein